MPEREGYIPGVPCWVDVNLPDPEAAARFYGELFGWQVEDVMPPGAGGSYFMARLRGRDVAGIGSGDGPGAWNTYVWVQSVEETADRVRAAGGRVLAEPFDVSDAGRMAVFADPEGAAFCAWQAGRHRGAAIVNEPGSLNFNGLHTADAGGARRFYGEVFGWRTIAMPGGGEAWTLPGYGDHLEEGDPGLRERMRSFGAPEGFEDVVASIQPLSGDAGPHWSVTFAADDVDRLAERALELGGSVLVEPFDAPWVRMTTIADPQGASFIASRFTPENRDVPAPASAMNSGG